MCSKTEHNRRLYQFPINWQALIWMWSSTLPINSLIDWHVPSETPILLGSASSKQVYDKHSNRHLDFANRIYLGCKLTNTLSTFILLICFKPFFHSSQHFLNTDLLLTAPLLLQMHKFLTYDVEWVISIFVFTKHHRFAYCRAYFTHFIHPQPQPTPCFT